MKELFQAIKAQLELLFPLELKLVAMDNGQIERVKEERDSFDKDNRGGFDFGSPAIFIKFNNTDQIEQMGGGVQIYPNLDVEVSIYHVQLDAGDGSLDQNLDVYDLKQEVYQAMNLFVTEKASQFVRVGELPDWNHNNVYIFQQTFGTTLVDDSRAEPYKGSIVQPPVDVDIDISYEDPA